jgi:hypothetical protein
MLSQLSLWIALFLLSQIITQNQTISKMTQTKQNSLKVEKINYKGWPNCYRLSNGIIDLIVTTDVGPRVIRFGFVDQENEFKEFENMLGKTGGNEWLPYGGHRLWHAPEHPVRTYYPDNKPVKVELYEGYIRLTQQVEETTGIQKEIDIYMSPDKPEVKIVHRIYNRNLWAVKLSAWALSVMAPGGTAIFPLPPRGTHPENLLPNTLISLWAYTDMTDPRWYWGKKFVLLKQNPNAKSPQKAGFMNVDGWAAYVRNGHMFVKTFDYIPNAHYPDFGCNSETWTNSEILELESLSPLTEIQPGSSIEHIEKWFLFKDVPTPKNDDDVDKYIIPLIKSLKK